MARHLPPADERCTARSRQTHERCKNYAKLGVKVCGQHGANAPQVYKKVQHAVIRKGLAGLVEPIHADDVEANPLEAFGMEFRRTVAAIRYFDSKILELTDEKDLVWGTTKMTDVGSSEFTGVDVVQESKMNIFYEARMSERKHLTDLMKLFIGAKLTDSANRMNADAINRLASVLDNVVVGLNADPHDPAVRAVMRAALTDAAAQEAVDGDKDDD